jgi:uncharacterized protein (TIGR02284 family)
MRLASLLLAAAAVGTVACGDRDAEYTTTGSPTGTTAKNDDTVNRTQGGNARAQELDELLRGEISAVETYNQALNRFGSEPGADELRRIRGEHQQAVDTLRGMVTSAGGTPSTSSGAWGGFAKAIEGAAKLFGNDAAFSALKEGEEHGLSEYDSALKDDDLTAADKDALRKLFDRQKEHVQAIDRLRARTD